MVNEMTDQEVQVLYDEVYACLNAPGSERYSWYGKKVLSIHRIMSTREELYVVAVENISSDFVLQRHFLTEGKLNLVWQDRIYYHRDTMKGADHANKHENKEEQEG